VGEEAQRIGPAVTEAVHHANDYAEAIVRIPPWVPTPANIRFKKASAELDRMVQKVIDERRGIERPRDGKDDLMTMLMEARDEETGEPMSDRQLRDEVMTLILAGHETTANLLSWTF